MFPELEEDLFDSLAFHLLYSPHGGNGLGLSLRDIEEMDYLRIKKWIGRLDEQREIDADAIRNANKPK